MSNLPDASFADGKEKPVKLIAQDRDDIQVVSALIQDSIAERKEMLYERERHSFSLLLKRLRWEDVEQAQQQEREIERVQSVLTIGSVQSVQFAGFEGQDLDLAFDLLGIIEQDGALHLVFAGDGEIKLSVEAIDLSLSDVSRPYIAKSQTVPRHKDV